MIALIILKCNVGKFKVPVLKIDAIFHSSQDQCEYEQCQYDQCEYDQCEYDQCEYDQ